MTREMSDVWSLCFIMYDFTVRSCACAAEALEGGERRGCESSFVTTTHHFSRRHVDIPHILRFIPPADKCWRCVLNHPPLKATADASRARTADHIHRRVPLCNPRRRLVDGCSSGGRFRIHHQMIGDALHVDDKRIVYRPPMRRLLCTRPQPHGHIAAQSKVLPLAFGRITRRVTKVDHARRDGKPPVSKDAVSA